MRKNIHQLLSFCCNIQTQSYTQQCHSLLFQLNQSCPAGLCPSFSHTSGIDIDPQKTSYSLMTIAFIILAILIACLLVKLKHRKDPRSRLGSNIPIDRDKIIIAIEIENFLVQINKRYGKGFLPIRIRNQDQTTILGTISRLLGFGHFYKPLHSLKKIKQFLSALSSYQEIELFLYTGIDSHIIQPLLKQLQLNDFFPIEKRKFCASQNSDMLKHAIQIDNQTRRVVILTPNKMDHCVEDQKYFLNLDSSNNSAIVMRETIWVIKKLVKNVQNMDYLHDQLAELKVQIQMNQQNC